MPSAGFSVKRRCELFSILCQHTSCRTKACLSLIYQLQGKALIEHYHTWQQSVPLIEEHCHTRQRCQSLLCHRGGGVGTADGKRSNALCTALGRTGTYTLHSRVHSSASYTAVLSALWKVGSATLQAAESTTGSATTSSLAPPCMELLLVLAPRCALGAGAGARAWLCKGWC